MVEEIAKNSLVSTHQQFLAESGYVLCMVVSGSMRPMLRMGKDSVLFVKPDKPIKRGDVVMFRRESGTMVMHRVVAVVSDGFQIRGDYSVVSEFVSEDQICGVMKGFYRGEAYISSEHLLYRLYSLCWMNLYPLYIRWKRVCKRLRQYDIF